MTRDYELMYIVRPDLDDEGVTAAMESVQSIIEGLHGEVVSTTPWGKRRLAYEIERLRDGHYVLLQVRLDGADVKELERLLSIHDTVFRHMLTVFVDDGTPHAAPGVQHEVDGEAVPQRGERRGRDDHPRGGDGDGGARSARAAEEPVPVTASAPTAGAEPAVDTGVSHEDVGADDEAEDE